MKNIKPNSKYNAPKFIKNIMEPKSMGIAEQYLPDDEIDLFDFFSSLYQQWRWLVGITLFGVVLSVAIALLLPKQYEVTAQLVLPDQVHVTVLANKGYVKQSRKELFKQYYETLISFDNFSRYVEQGDWLSKIYPNGVEQGSGRQLLIRLRKALRVEVAKPKPIKGTEAGAPEIVMLILLGENEVVVANFINGYIDYSGKALIALIAQTGQQQQRLEVEKINIDMRVLREDNQKKLTARLKSFNEALVMAEKVGIKKPNDMKEQTLSQGVDVNTRLGGSDLFLKGSEYLKQTITTLQSRKSQDPFIEGLFPLFAKLNQLDAMSFDFTGVQPYRLDMQAVVDGKAEKPKRMLIVAVGGALSLFVGVFAALIMGAVKRRRELMG